jgi:ABC-type Fe3+ transport system substrate-binding protein
MGKPMSINRFYPVLVAAALTVCNAGHTARADSYQRIVELAKTEKELVFVSGAGTFGGSKAFAEIEARLNAKFGLNGRIRHVAGPSFGPMAARVSAELKAGAKSSTDVYLANPGYHVPLVEEKVLKEVDWSSIFPWVRKEMEVVPKVAISVYTGLYGILYNPKLIAVHQAPKSYEDLVNPNLSSTWAGKMAIPPYTGWLVQLSHIWGATKTKEFSRKMVSLSGGQVRYNEAPERIISGEFPIMASIGGVLEAVWNWQEKNKNVPLEAVLGTKRPALTDYYALAVPKHAAHPNLAMLFVAFMVSQEGQTILEKHDARSSHLVEGTRLTRFVRENNIQLQDSGAAVAFHQKYGEDLATEFGNILRRK